MFACILVAMILTSCGNSGGQHDRVVARSQETFFETFVGRQLSRDEIRQVTDEFIRYYALQGKDREGTREAAGRFEGHARTLRDEVDGPAALTLRHGLITFNYFDPNVQNTLVLRLLTEPDPVRVVGTRAKRLMTEKDVVAWANLHRFSVSQGPPRHEQLSRRQIEDLVSRLDRAFGSHPDSQWMPLFYTETAALWAGIRQHWPKLSAEEKRLVRAYAGKGWQAYMPPAEMYTRLLGLNPSAASSRVWNDLNSLAIFNARMQPWVIPAPALN